MRTHTFQAGFFDKKGEGSQVTSRSNKGPILRNDAEDFTTPRERALLEVLQKEWEHQLAVEEGEEKEFGPVDKSDIN